MKIRSGFVSNSSSSSFIVATEKGQESKLVIDIETECDVISTEEELREHYMNYHEEESELLDNPEYVKCLKLLKEGKVIKSFTASNDDYDSMLSGLYGHTIKKNMFDGNVTIINEGDC